MTLKPGFIIKSYEVIEIIGKGSMGNVYLGEKDNNFYAIKELKTEFSSPDEEKILMNAFEREADLLLNMFHPGVPKFYKFFTHKGNSYIIMEFIKGQSLEDIIKSSVEPFDEKKALNWIIQICEILFFLHTLSPEPVIFRDLKPSNIIVTEGNVLRLIDFGVARRYDPAKDSDTVRLGTPGYAAPEQYRKKGQSLPQSDIYALGIIFYELLTLYDPSVTPFRLPSLRKRNNKISEQLEWIINKAINLDFRDRYLDAGLFRDELVDYYEENFTQFTSPYIKNLPYMKEEKSLSPNFPGWPSFLKFQTSLFPLLSPHSVYLCDQIDNFCYQIPHFFRRTGYKILYFIRGTSGFSKLMLGWLTFGVIWLIYLRLCCGYFCINGQLTYLFCLPLLYFIANFIRK